MTAVIPTYQRADLIVRCVRSVLDQTRPPDRVIVVDDGSTDRTLELLAQFEDEVDVIAQANAGASAARNVGVERADTEWIVFCDSDDLWEPGHLEALERAADETAGRAAIYFQDTLIAESDGGGSFFDVAGLSVPEGSLQVHEPPVAWVDLRLQPMLLQASMIRRSIYLDIGGLSDALRTRHDTHLFHRLGYRHTMCAVGGIGVRLCDDADDAGRLTGHNGQRSRSFWAESAVMHADLLRIAPDPSHRRAMRRALGGDHLRLALDDLGSRALRDGAGNLATALWVSPGTVARMTYRAARRRVRDEPPDLSRIPR